MRYSLLLLGVALLLAFVSADHHVKNVEHHGKVAGGAAKTEVAAIKAAVQLQSKTEVPNELDQKAHHIKKSGKKFNHDHEKAAKGKSGIVLLKKEHEEQGGKKHRALEEAHHKDQDHKAGSGAHGAKYKTGAQRRKSGFEKGFREQYHKDEQKKSDTWFSNKHKSGDWVKFGSGKSKHHASKHEKDSHGKYHVAKHSDKHGKEQKFAGGHAKADHKGYKSQHGAQQHHAKHEEYAKKKAHAKH